MKNIENIVTGVRSISYDIMLGCENFEEFNYLRAVSSTILAYLMQCKGDRVDWVELYKILDVAPTENLDPKLVDAMDDYRIAIMEFTDAVASYNI